VSYIGRNNKCTQKPLDSVKVKVSLKRFLMLPTFMCNNNELENSSNIPHFQSLLGKDALALTTQVLGSWVQILLETRMHICVFQCCVVPCR
jgi:hypothetical protein